MADPDLNTVHSREELIRLFDGHSEEGIFQPESGRSARVPVKSYLLETTPSVTDGIESLTRLFSRTGHRLRPVDEKLAAISGHDNGGVLGFVEALMDRHLAIYTIQKSQKSDPWIRDLVNSSHHLDKLWLSGQLFDVLWRRIEKEKDRKRFVKLTFEYESIFEIDGENGDDDVEYVGEESEPIAEKRASKFTVVDQISFLRDKLPALRDLYAPLFAISQLRIPSGVGPGGHDFYLDGKVTNRSHSFRDHRLKLMEILEFYRSFTDRIEKETWTQFEEVEVERNRIRVTGNPLVMRFSHELENSTFEHWIESTFRRKNNRFRLWGDPIRLGDKKVHVYGLDRHLWQPVELEISTTHLIAVLPKGTCGNTVHRLVTNVQRYVDPAVVVTVAGKRYMDIARGQKTTVESLN